MHFTHAIVCPPCNNFIYGITTASLGKPNYLNALVQHKEYVELLKKMGLRKKLQKEFKALYKRSNF